MSNEIMKYTDVQKAILKTVAFFDIFDYPLTLLEIHKWLYHAPAGVTLSGIDMELRSEPLSQAIEEKDGFYFLAGRQYIVRTRLDRYQVAEHKFKIALRTVRWLRWFAFIEMMGVCNNVGYNNGTAKSDIDFFIVVAQNRLWWSRLIISMVTSLLRVRRHGVKIVDRVCLSFYTATNHLNLTDIALDYRDPYLTYWFATLAPIYSSDMYSQFLQENQWVYNELPNWYPVAMSDRRSVTDSQLISFLKNIDKRILGGGIGDILERLAKALEFGHVRKYFGDAMNQPDKHVVISSSMLKFHKTDRRLQYRQLWDAKLQGLEVLE